MKPIRVVLVDDSKVFLDAIHSGLAQWANIEIAGCAASGAEGLGPIERHQPDLILMDVYMAGMNGSEASRRIVRGAGLPKVVLMSSIEDPGLPQIALDSGTDTFVFKQDLYSDLPPLIAQWFGTRPGEPA